MVLWSHLLLLMCHCYSGQFWNDTHFDITSCTDILGSLVILANLVKHKCSRREVIRKLGFLASVVAPGKMSKYSELQATFALAGKEQKMAPQCIWVLAAGLQSWTLKGSKMKDKVLICSLKGKMDGKLYAARNKCRIFDICWVSHS